jgi:hypothetical protein
LWGSGTRSGTSAHGGTGTSNGTSGTTRGE